MIILPTLRFTLVMAAVAASLLALPQSVPAADTGERRVQSAEVCLIGP